MAPIFIIIGFALGYLFAKMLEPRNLCPRNWGYKLLLCIGIPCLIYGVVFLIVGMNCNWWMYKVGSATATTFLGCIALLISMLIFVKVKKNDTSRQIEIPEVAEETTPIPVNEPAAIETEIPEVINENVPEEATTNPPTITSPVRLELNGILTGLFGLWMVVAGIKAIINFASNVEGSYAIGAFDLAFTFLGIVGIAGMYAKKRWGLFVAGIFFVLQFIFCLIIGETDSSFYEEAFKVVIRVIVICSLLFIQKNGHSAWETIWNNGVLNPETPSTENNQQEEPQGKDLPPIPEDIVEKLEVKEQIAEMKESIAEIPAIADDVIPEQPVEKKLFNFKQSFIKYWDAIVSFINNFKAKHRNCGDKGTVWIKFISITIGVLVFVGIVLAIVVSASNIPNYVHGVTHRVKYTLGMKDDTVAWELYRLAKEAEDNDMYELTKEYLIFSYGELDKDKELIEKLFQLSFSASANEYEIVEEAYNACSRFDYTNDPELMVKMAYLLYVKEDTDNAIKFAQKAYLADPDNGLKASVIIYQIYCDRQDWENTLKWTEKALELDSELARAYYCRAKALFEKKDKKEAWRIYRKGYLIDTKEGVSSYGRNEFMGLANDYSSQILADFVATIEAKPTVQQKYLYDVFPEFDNDPEMLDAAYRFFATYKSKGNMGLALAQKDKFPEFFFK